MSKWSKIKLEELLRRSAETAEIRPDESYREITVRLWGKGVVLRGVVQGTEIAGSRRFVARTGQLILSRIDARNGAIGIVPELLDGAVVTNDFPVFDLAQDRVLPVFLNWISKTASFVELCQRASEGTTNRVRLQEERFLGTKISLPPLDDQRRIMAQLEGLARRVQEIRALRQEQELSMRSMLLSTFYRITRDAQKQPMAQTAPLVRRSVTIEPLGSYPELGIRSFGKGTFHKPALTGLELGGKRIFRIEPGDLLFSNVFAWEGAIAVARPKDKGRFGSHRFITCVPKAGVATSDFLRFFFLTDEGMGLIRAASPGGAGRNRTLGLEALAAIGVPVPPLKKQQWFDALQVQVWALRESQAENTAELDALLPSVLDRVFRGETATFGDGSVSPLETTKRRQRRSSAPIQELVRVIVTKPIKKHSKGLFYRRAALDCYIISALPGDPNLGRTKIEKLSHLIEYHCGVDLEREPVRDAAGPNDYPSRRKVESLAGRLKWYSTRTQADRAKVDYVPGPAITKSHRTAERLLGTRKGAVDALLHLMKPLDTKQSEIIATLYAAWNDFLLIGKTPADDEIVREVRDNWHSEKRSIPVEQWRKALIWMRKSQLVPRGIGKPVPRRSNM